MTERATISIAFTDYWLSSTGGSGEGDLDMIAYRDGFGCPAMPMMQIKGSLRETAEMVLGCERAVALFGGEGSKSQSQIRFVGDATLREEVRAWFGHHDNLSARAALFDRLRATAITKSGVAKTASLRTLEVAVPMTLSAIVEWVEGKPDPNWVDDLNTVCQLTFAFGHGKNDGLGRALATCKGNPTDCTTEDTDHTDWSGSDIIALTLIPQDRAVFSNRNVNLGEHESLAGPPGSALWGWAIGKLRGDDAALKALLAGQVRFSDAVPLIGDEPSYPVPANLFAPKLLIGDENKADNEGVLNDKTIAVGMAAFEALYPPDDNASDDNAKFRQAKAVKPGHVTLDLANALRPETAHRLRSAHLDGKAKDASLFGYQSVEPGSNRYRAEISRNGVCETIWQAICESFAGSIVLGKARNAGYGGSYKCAVEAGGLAAVDAPPDNLIYIRCLSDLAMTDQWGMLDVEPADGAAFGLTGWQLDRTACTISTRRFAPWDRMIGHAESEITVIEAGSVFAFRRPEGDTSKPIIKRHVGNLGQRGFGHVATMPNAVPTSAPRAPESKKCDLPEKPPNCIIIKSAEARAKRRDTVTRDKWMHSVRSEIETSLANAIKHGPSRTQWSHITLTNLGDGRSEHGWTPQLLAWLKEQKGKIEAMDQAHQAWAINQLIKRAKEVAPAHGKTDR